MYGNDSGNDSLGWQTVETEPCNLSKAATFADDTKLGDKEICAEHCSKV